MSNREKEISLLKEELADVDRDEKLLGKEEDELLTTIKELETDLKERQFLQRQLSHKRSNNMRQAQNIIYRLQKLEAEQRAFERREKIKEIRSRQPSFIDCVEEELFRLFTIMEKRKQLLNSIRKKII